MADRVEWSVPICDVAPWLARGRTGNSAILMEPCLTMHVHVQVLIHMYLLAKLVVLGASVKQGELKTTILA